MLRLSLCSCFLFVSFCFAQADVPSKFVIKSEKAKYLPCRMMKVTAEGGGKTVLWRFEGDLSDTEVDGKTLRFVAADKNRNITIKAYTASADGDVLEAVLVLEPDVPPLPSDPLVAEIRKMVTEADKPQVKKLAALYKLMAAECNKAEYKTATDINNMYRVSASNLVGDTLMNVRTKLSEEIAAVVSDPDANITPEIRTSLANVFLHLYRICSEV